jgi:hypothetical protein
MGDVMGTWSRNQARIAVLGVVSILFLILSPALINLTIEVYSRSRQRYGKLTLDDDKTIKRKTRNARMEYAMAFDLGVRGR